MKNNKESTKIGKKFPYSEQTLVKGQSLEFIVLAAGLGTRMKSPLPKVLHEIAGVPMIGLLCGKIFSFLEAHTKDSQAVNDFRLNVVIGHGREQVRSFVQECFDVFRRKHTGKNFPLTLSFTVQEEQLGTGHAVKLALASTNTKANPSDMVIVLNGDLPLLSDGILDELVNAHAEFKSTATLGSMVLERPGAYGRILRKGKKFVGVCEYKDASPAQRRISEVNGGVYVFNRSFIQIEILQIKNQNKAKEFYLPALFDAAVRQKKNIHAHIVSDPEALHGVNDQLERSQAQQKLFKRINESWMKQGVSFMSPETTYIDPRTTLKAGVVIYPGVILQGACEIGSGVKLEANVFLKKVKVGDQSVLKQGTVAEDAEIDAGCKVGPMAHLRPGTKLEANVKVGNFVEIKEASIGEGSSIAHLSYVGDAFIGKRVNIGCGFVTCNYDGTVRNGRRKHQSIIGDDVFIGSDCQVIAPLQLAAGTFIASGSTVTESTKEAGSFVIARSRQVTKPGYAKKYKPK